MGDTGYFKGTSADQDSRFSNKQQKLRKSMVFPPEFDKQVDMNKVNKDIMRPWITQRTVDLLGFEDDVLINFIFGQLEDVQFPDPKDIQINLTGFLEKRTPKFMLTLWRLLLSAQENPSGIPQEFVDKKLEEIKAKQALNRQVTTDPRFSNAAASSGNGVKSWSSGNAAASTMHPSRAALVHGGSNARGPTDGRNNASSWTSRNDRSGRFDGRGGARSGRYFDRDMDQSPQRDREPLGRRERSPHRGDRGRDRERDHYVSHQGRDRERNRRRRSLTLSHRQRDRDRSPNERRAREGTRRHRDDIRVSSPSDRQRRNRSSTRSSVSRSRSRSSSSDRSPSPDRDRRRRPRSRHHAKSRRSDRSATPEKKRSHRSSRRSPSPRKSLPKESRNTDMDVDSDHLVEFPRKETNKTRRGRSHSRDHSRSRSQDSDSSCERGSRSSSVSSAQSAASTVSSR